MSRRLTIVTFGVSDLALARRFYVDGLGWEPTFEVAGEVVFIQVAPGVLLSLWGRDAMEADMGVRAGEGSTITLARNVEREQDVAAVLAQAQAAGAKILKPAQPAFFGGVQGYFEDPCGFRWEVAWNPGLVVEADGTVRFVDPD